MRSTSLSTLYYNLSTAWPCEEANLHEESTFDATATPTFQIKYIHSITLCSAVDYPIWNTIGAMLDVEIHYQDLKMPRTRRVAQQFRQSMIHIDKEYGQISRSTIQLIFPKETQIPNGKHSSTDLTWLPKAADQTAIVEANDGLWWVVCMRVIIWHFEFPIQILPKLLRLRFAFAGYTILMMTPCPAH